MTLEAFGAALSKAEEWGCGGQQAAGCLGQAAAPGRCFHWVAAGMWVVGWVAKAPP